MFNGIGEGSGEVTEVLRYDKMVEQALRGVVREALAVAASQGMPGAHHFYITFHTADPGVEIPDHLHARYPDVMTIVLEHQFWDLEVTEQALSVTLSFNNKPERLVVPFDAITAFADPAVKFGLQFQPSPEAAQDGEPEPNQAVSPAETADKTAGKSGEVVTLDAFRKK